MLVPILRKTMFDFSFLTASASKDVVIQPALDVSQFYRVRMIARIHSITIGSGQSFSLIAQNTLPSEEDPLDFTDTASAFLTLTITSGSPVIQTQTQTDPQAFLKILLRAQQSSAASSPLYAELSAVAVLREH